MTKLRTPAVLLALAVMTVAAFQGVRRSEFVRLDDPAYVFENPRVRAGITAEGFRWALTSTDAANWHPLTWISHMLDVEFFGLDPGAHHLTNLFWHTANTLLLFLLLRGLTGAHWRSAFAAALFGIHPLHVESVAWVAERKDVLSAFFWMASSTAYLRFARTRSTAGYAAALALFALGLAAKPMLVTLPLVFLLLDYWPLGRLSLHPHQAAGTGAAARLFPVLREKLPFLALAAASSLITLKAQQAGSMMRDLTAYPLAVRLENGAVSYVRYLGKALWPAGLAIPYGHPGSSLTFLQVGGAALLLAALTALALLQRRRRPYAAAGWLWFLGTLVPVIGLVQVSDQAMADRYTYIPLVGLSLALAWTSAGVIARTPQARGAAATGAVLLLAPLVAMTALQVGHWRDNVSLFRNTARVTKRENLAHLSMALRKQEMLNAGMSRAAVEIRMGDEMNRHGKFDEAAAFYRRALELDPGQDAAHTRLGALYLHLGRYSEAAGHFAKAARMRPQDSTAHTNLGLAYRLLGRNAEARQRFGEALRLDPGNQKAAANLRELP